MDTNKKNKAKDESRSKNARMPVVITMIPVVAMVMGFIFLLSSVFMVFYSNVRNSMATNPATILSRILLVARYVISPISNTHSVGVIYRFISSLLGFYGVLFFRVSITASPSAISNPAIIPAIIKILL